MPIDAQRWQRLSPWLDQLLAQPEPEREAWLVELGQRDATLAAELRALWDGPPREPSPKWLEQSAAGIAAIADAAPLSPPALAGQRIGAYTLVAPLGEGGMGAVWLAERSDGSFEARAAVKLLHGGLVQRAVAARFRREGAVLARLSHPHIARLIDAGLTDDGQPYLVLEHVAGERIDRWCDERKLDLRARVALFDQVLQAVQHAHAQLVVHRDLKPANVLVDGEGRVKLLDFGIAKLLDADDVLQEATELTRDGARVLTPQYAAPEQTQGDAITTATDVFALGLLLFLLLTGQHPRVDAKGRHAMSVGDLPRASQVVQDTGRRSLPELNASASARGTTPARLAHAVAGDLDNILAKALRVDPAERYGTVAALADDLRRHLDGQTVSARPDSFAYRTSRFIVRHKLGAALATAALATIVGTAVLADQQRRAAVRERDLTAQQQASSEAVAVFMEELLGQVGDDGRGLDPAALLDHAERRAQQLFFDHPDVLAHLHGHFLIVNFYLGREDHVERSVQAIAAAASAIDDPVARAQAACLGTLRTDDIPAALAIIDTALASLPDVPRSRSVRWNCGFERGEVLRVAGRFQEAAAAYETARRAAPPLYDRLRAISNTRARAELLASLGQLAAADEAMVQASRLLEEAGRGRSLAMVSQLLMRAGLHSRMGRPRQSLALIEQARAMARGARGAAGLAPSIEMRAAFELLQLVTLSPENVSLAECFNPSKEDGNDEDDNEGALHARVQARGCAAGRRRPEHRCCGPHAGRGGPDAVQLGQGPPAG